MKTKKIKIVDAVIEEDKEKPFFLPRALAYIIDVVIVFLLSAIISMGLPQDSNHEKYVEEYKQIQSQYMNKEISRKEYNAKSKDVVYDIDYTNTGSSLVTVVILLLYYVGFQFYNKGQTLGKKIMKLRVVSTNGKVLSVNQIAIRTLLVNSILINILLIGTVLFVGRDYYYYASYGMQALDSVLMISILIMILFRKDARGLHDLLAHTRVISEKKV